MTTENGDDARSWLSRHLGLVRLRQLADVARHRLSFVPILYVLGAIALVQLLLWFDGRLSDEELPSWLETTVPSARSVFAAIAGGLITSITLLLSMMLITVQLASSQFSPRTLRDWLGNRRLQHAIGLVLGTTVFCLLALRSTRDFGENEAPIIPHTTVVVAVGLGIVCLVAVVQAVDHITDNLRVESVAKRLTDETIAVIHRAQVSVANRPPRVGPDSGALAGGGGLDVPSHASPVPAPATGWLQQVDEDVLLDALPEHSTAYLTSTIGTFVVEHGPLLWVAPAPGDDSHDGELLEAFAIGDTRTSQQDIEFGIIQLTDIAVRALSPGVNDPSTACEIVAHHGAVLTALWAQPIPENTRRDGTRTLVQRRRSHADLLHRAIDPILHYGASDPQTLGALRSMLAGLLSEVRRRQLPGPTDPIEQLLADVGAAQRRHAQETM